MRRAEGGFPGDDDAGATRTTAAPLPQAPLDDAQRLACLRLIRSEGVGPVAFRTLINRFGGADEALDALPDLARRGGRSRPLRLCPRERAEAELAAASRAGARPVFTIEPGYPPALAHVDVPPPMLYLRGDVALLQRPALAIVGSRQSSAAGLSLAQSFGQALGAAGYVIVSGLARGIDTAAHRAALDTGTVAVLAGGIDHVYPPENAVLLETIAARGCLVSEQPPGFTPRATDFPRRNRIIAGIALGVLIVEAARRSGTLITARLAAEMGRDVMAVPGHPLDPRAEGTNQLLKDGAALVTSPEDVLATLAGLGGRPVASPQPLAPTPTEPARREPDASSESVRDLVLAGLGPAPVSIDQLARALHLPIQDVQGVLLELSLAGRIVLHGAQLVSRA
ncbi:MAG: DNA-processing protein DprA [Hyphomicrobiaceae bacterium]